ncbi:Hypothetical predicted protein, partial [Marmota monax]
PQDRHFRPRDRTLIPEYPRDRTSSRETCTFSRETLLQPTRPALSPVRRPLSLEDQHQGKERLNPPG